MKKTSGDTFAACGRVLADIPWKGTGHVLNEEDRATLESGRKLILELSCKFSGMIPMDEHMRSVVQALRDGRDSIGYEYAEPTLAILAVTGNVILNIEREKPGLHVGQIAEAMSVCRALSHIKEPNKKS